MADALKQPLAPAQDYQSWLQASLADDEKSGANAWKARDDDPGFDYKVVRLRHNELKALVNNKDIDGLCYYLNEGIHGNMGGMGAPKLYTHARVGTKNLIRDYNETLVKALQLIEDAPARMLSKASKVDHFRRASHSYGHSALMLSGAGSLGPFHLGVAKTLFEHNLLPRIISGSSAGSLVAALIGTHDGRELEARFTDTVMRSFFRWAIADPFEESPTRPLDQYDLLGMIEALVPDMTFLEAFEKTGRYINISVAPKEVMQRSRLLNAVNSPNATIREAVLASCAIPGLLPAVTLMAKTSSGKKKPYVPSRQWIDGSVSDDLPARRLARMYGVNHTISSQANPLVLWALQNPFDQDNLMTRFADIYQSAARQWLRAIYPWAMESVKDQYPLNVMTRGAFSVLTQDYKSDITIMPRQKLYTPNMLTERLSPEEAAELIRDGQQSTWPVLERIRICTMVSRCLDDTLMRMDGTIR